MSTLLYSSTVNLENLMRYPTTMKANQKESSSLITTRFIFTLHFVPIFHVLLLCGDNKRVKSWFSVSPFCLSVLIPLIRILKFLKNSTETIC